MAIDPDGYRREQQQTAGGGENKGNGQYQFLWPSKIREAITNKFESYREKNSSPEYRRERREVWTVRWLFLTVVFTFITAAIFYCQLSEMEKVYGPVQVSAEAAKKSADTAERTFTELERPYIFVNTPRIDPEAWHFSPEGNRLPNIDYTLTNHGRTPAVVRWVTMEIKGPELSDQIRFLDIFNGQLILAQGQTEAGKTFSNKAPLPNAYKDLTDLRFIVTVTYSDVFNYMHVNRFVFLIFPNSQFVPMGGQVYSEQKSQKISEIPGGWQPGWSHLPDD